MRLFWISVAGVCLIAAIVFLARQRLDAAFVFGALAGAAWFLGYRVQMKSILADEDLLGTGRDDDEDVES